jgi:hypothetical protein
MKLLGSIVLAALTCGLLAVVAQEATDLDLNRDQAPSPAPQPSPAASLPDVSDIDQIFKQTSLGKEADDQRMRIEWRELSNRMANDPEVIAAKKYAESARTDLEKRQRLRAYYEIYYGKMRALASSAVMRKALDDMKLEHLSHINQPRVRHETDGALPTPSTTPHHHHK